MTEQHIELNGVPANVDDLRAIALVNYGHFTSMQVRNGCVRGLDLHLGRLDVATRELFGCPLDVAQTRGWMRRLVGDSAAPLLLRVNVFARRLDRDRLNLPVVPDVLVASGAPRMIAPSPLRVQCALRTRGAAYQARGYLWLVPSEASGPGAGFDDALFVDAHGAVSEGTVWNVGFFDGARIVWPDAPALDGISMQLLKRGLHEQEIKTITRRIAIADIGAFRSAFFTNSSCTAVPIASIDATRFVVDADLLATLDSVAAAVPWQLI